MPNDERSVRVRLGEAVQAYQAGVDDYDRELVRLLGVNETDLRCLEILIGAEEAAPSALAHQLGLTTGSVTTMLDRLEKMDYITRTPHPTDRRKSLVRVTPRASERAAALMGPFLDEAFRLLDRYTPDQLELVTDFLAASHRLQEFHVQRLRELPAPRTRRAVGGRRAPSPGDGSGERG
jgi:DNA-binding MarR family transcriptional regulator